MKKTISFSLIAFIALIVTINGLSQNKTTNLNETAFAQKIKEMPNAPLIDVRTPDEFSKGHLLNAINYDWNGSEFDKQVSSLDKSSPLFIYCLSGGRSGAAANKLRASGFKEVIELDGGIMKWRAANLPETKENKVFSKGLSRQSYNDLLKTPEYVLIDFYADWCAPCKKMKPYLEEISKENKDRIKVVRINADDNQNLCKELKVDALPVLLLYKNGKQIWKNVGYISKDKVMKQVK